MTDARRVMKFVAAWGIVVAAALLAGISVQAAATERPRLVVVISIDQFPYEYLVRMRRGFAPDGLFERLLREGTVFSACHHGQAFTYTAPGHSVLLTGAFPSRTGIVDNEWFDRRTNRKIYCVFDPEYSTVGGGVPPASPRSLLVSTLGDVLKLTDPRSKVFGVSIKDRAAILMAGHRPDGVYWYDEKQTGNWVTSTYYRPDLPGYLREFNESQAVESFGGQTWDLLLDASHYPDYYPDDAPFESSMLGRAFPHVMPAANGMNYYDRVVRSPFGNDITLAAASRVIEYERLGQGDATDLFVLNLSSNDYVGHAYGPHSREVYDMTYRTDRQLGAFVREIESRLAGAPWILALSSDHGVGPVPEFALTRGLPAARNPLGDLNAHRQQVEARLTAALGPASTGFIESFDYGDVYFRESALTGDARRTAERIVRDYLLEQPSIAAAYTRETLLVGGASEPLARQFERTFHPARSGDVLFCLKPYQISGTAPATHGSPWHYDSHVPLIFWGAGVPAKIDSTPITPAALAPTVAQLLGIEAPPGTSVPPAPLNPPVPAVR